MDRLDLLYAHIEDPAVPVQETVEAFAGLVDEGAVDLLGVSNHSAWRVERARSVAAAAGLPGYEILQYHHSYLRPRTDLPGQNSRDGDPHVLGGDLLSYLRAEPGIPAGGESDGSALVTPDHLRPQGPTGPRRRL